MAGVANISGGQGVLAGGQSQIDGGVTLVVEGGAGKRVSVVSERDGAGGGKSIVTNDGDCQVGDGAAGLVAGFRGERGLGGLCLCRKAMRGETSRGQSQRNAQSCNRFKPQTAADDTSHVHLLQISRKSQRITRMPVTIVSGAGAVGLWRRWGGRVCLLV